MEKQTQLALRVSRTSILVNLFLSVFKLAAGLLSHSGMSAWSASPPSFWPSSS